MTWHDVQTLPVHVYDTLVEMLLEDQKAWNHTPTLPGG